MFVEYSRLQSGVGDTVGEAVVVAVSDGVSVDVGVSVSVGVGVSDGVGVSEGVGVSDGVKDGVGVKVGAPMVAGRPTTRAVRNCSMIPSRLATRCSCGQTELMIGTISGCSESMGTATRSPGPPGSSNGSHSAGMKDAWSEGQRMKSGVGGSSPAASRLEQTVMVKKPGWPGDRGSSRRIEDDPARGGASIEGRRGEHPS